MFKIKVEKKKDKYPPEYVGFQPPSGWYEIFDPSTNEQLCIGDIVYLKGQGFTMYCVNDILHKGMDYVPTLVAVSEEGTRDHIIELTGGNMFAKVRSIRV